MIFCSKVIITKILIVYKILKHKGYNNVKVNLDLLIYKTMKNFTKYYTKQVIQNVNTTIVFGKKYII